MLVGTVAKREADLSMNLALTGAREKVIDYSVAYIGWTPRRCISFTSPHLMLHSPDEPLTFSVSSPLPLPQVCQNWPHSRYFVPLPIICCSGTASTGLIKHKLGFYFWLSCFSWVRILCCCCCCGIVLNPKIGLFSLSGPVLGLVRICGRKEENNQRQSVILENSFLDTYKINLGIGIDPVYHPDFKKLFLLLVNSFY